MTFWLTVALSVFALSTIVVLALCRAAAMADETTDAWFVASHPAERLGAERERPLPRHDDTSTPSRETMGPRLRERKKSDVVVRRSDALSLVPGDFGRDP